MERQSLYAYLRERPYPGRGIVMGMDAAGEHGVMAYWIMGRSANSRNRVFVEQEDGGIETRAYDESKLIDPSLIIYAPVRVPSPDTWVVTNGDQTDTICDFFAAGKSFADALRTRTFEPDLPNCTPRISGLMSLTGGELQVRLSILKSRDSMGSAVIRDFFEYAQPTAGEGHLIHTYAAAADPLPPFVGEPVTVALPDDQDAFTQKLWDSLDEDNRISLYTCYVSLTDRTATTRIINKYC